MEIPGIHHVTAVTADAQRNVDFYAGVLGLRLVKLTVNYDDPSVYHIYYGDGTGRPGSIVTFFAWPGASRGRLGTGMAGNVAFDIPPEAAAYWTGRLERHGVESAAMHVRDRGEVIAFKDPDGLPVELVARAGSRDGAPWAGAGVPPERAIRGIFGVTLLVKRAAETVALLGMLGLRHESTRGSRLRCIAGADGAGSVVEVAEFPLLEAGSLSAGTVHHVALRAPDAAAQRYWRDRVADAGIAVTRVIDRTYFRSIYFREPGGVLIEVATDGPGFAVDEAVQRLGAALMLPESLAAQRERLARQLPPLRLPRAA